MVILVTVAMLIFVGILGIVLCCKRFVTIGRHFVTLLLAQLLTAAVL